MTGVIFIAIIAFTLIMALRCTFNDYNYREMLEDDGK
jgi:hypothetical protein